MEDNGTQLNIKDLLALSDQQLQQEFGGFGPDIRGDLESKMEKGEVFIGPVHRLGTLPDDNQKKEELCK